MPIEGVLQQKGIADLLLKDANVPVLMNLATSLTKHVIEINSHEDALKTIYTQMPNAQALLSKKVITKDILFKYVHSNQIPVTADFTKSILIDKIIEYWERERPTNRISDQSQQTNLETESISNSQPRNECQLLEEEFPINLMARTFAQWFYENYNSNKLKVEDFWKDSRLMLRIASGDNINDQHCQTSEQVIETLFACKRQFNLFFNPNISHDGVQGRMDVHGLVIVLVCGTLHTEESCVGVFETSFGLMRDPFALNNWKIKTVQSLLKSQGSPKAPILSDSDTLRDSLALPAPKGEIG